MLMNQRDFEISIDIQIDFLIQLPTSSASYSMQQKLGRAIFQPSLYDDGTALWCLDLLLTASSSFQCMYFDECFLIGG